jgi:isopenicillin N synthase-like dioxygenase
LAAILSQDLDQHPVSNDRNLLGEVPVIDVASLVGATDAGVIAARPVVDDIARACRDWGFVQVVNHGVSPELVDDVQSKMRRFFELPDISKQAILRTRENPWGYYNNELTKNRRDKKEVFDFTTPGIDPIYASSNRWPSVDGNFQQLMSLFLDACSTLSLRLLEAFCVGLDLPPDHLHTDFVDNHTSFVRLNHYPVRDPLEGSVVEHQATAGLGVHHHTDAGALTVLLQDEVGGLQVYRDGFWHDIAPQKGAFVINTADMMQVWSNDIYQAAIHRVLAMNSVDRYSIPFFYNPAAHTRVRPLPGTVSESRPEAYETIHWGEFRGKRTDGDYADYGAEVQIAQYRK